MSVLWVFYQEFIHFRGEQLINLKEILYFEQQMEKGLTPGGSTLKKNLADD